MTKPTQDKETLRERPRLETIAFAAWVNVAPDKIPPEFRAPTCEHTMAAWKRVADAIEADVFERLRAPSEGMIEAGESVFDTAAYADLVGPTEVWQAMLAAFQQENSECRE